jgi:AcrR family transcriptional regulator
LCCSTRPDADLRAASPVRKTGSGCEQIVRAAIEVLDAEGPTGLSMSRLGTKLGSGATSLYWHVVNKDELLSLAVDEMLSEVYVPVPATRAVNGSRN